jgi:hypothetical protein
MVFDVPKVTLVDIDFSRPLRLSEVERYQQEHPDKMSKNR